MATSSTTDPLSSSDLSATTPSSPLVFVTGFGPLYCSRSHKSWDVVQCLDSQGVQYNGSAVDLRTLNVPVSYRFVQHNFKTECQRLNPRLCIHVGVSDSYEQVKIELRARNGLYDTPQQRDVSNPRQLPLQYKCDTRSGASDELQTSFCLSCLKSDLERQYSSHEDSAENVCFVKSSDAGMYLCEFLYYESLELSAVRDVLLVHIPLRLEPDPYSKQNLANVLKSIVKNLLGQLDSRPHTECVCGADLENTN